LNQLIRSSALVGCLGQLFRHVTDWQSKKIFVCFQAAMDLDANVATFLEFQKVVQNLNTFELSSQSLGYVISKEAVQWNKNFQEVEDEGGNKEYNEQLRKRQVAFDLYDSLQSIVSHLSASVQACCGGTLSGYSRYFDVGQFGNLGTQFSFYDKVSLKSFHFYHDITKVFQRMWNNCVHRLLLEISHLTRRFMILQ
jgi:hypothetical protein